MIDPLDFDDLPDEVMWELSQPDYDFDLDNEDDQEGPPEKPKKKKE